jgi:hypothetical protein
MVESWVLRQISLAYKDMFLRQFDAQQTDFKKKQ